MHDSPPATLDCQEHGRRAAARRHRLNGINFIEVSDAGDELHVHLFRRVPRDSAGSPVPVSAENVRITGGRRVPEVRVLEAHVATAADAIFPSSAQERVIVVKVERPNDLSPYTLQLVRAAATAAAPAAPAKPDEIKPPGLLDRFDPRFAAARFSFAQGCPSDLDCTPPAPRPATPPAEPQLDYLGRDYAAFRRLILDRLALVMPEWKERAVPDLGIALVEVLAFVGDRLSYFQDAVATEAYLGTARQRISLRRHARLVDYLMHEGCNARALLCLRPTADTGWIDLGAVSFKTGAPDPSGTPPRDGRIEPAVFLPLAEPRDALLQAGDIFDWRTLVEKLIAQGPRPKREEDDEYADGENEAALPVIARVWSRLKIALRSRLLAQPDAGDLALRETLLAGLNRVLRDRGFFLGDPTTEDKEMIAGNRETLEAELPDEIAVTGKVRFYAAHGEIQFHSWGDSLCSLPKGATAATLDDYLAPSAAAAPAPAPVLTKAQQAPPPAEPEKPARRLHLRVGELLIFEEILGPATGLAADADPTHRHAVRLTRVTPGEDRAFPVEVGKGADGKPILQPRPVLEIEWAAEDALPFSLTLSARAPADLAGKECKTQKTSVARGNVVLVDHGARIKDEDLGAVSLIASRAECRCEGTVADPETTAGRFEPILAKTELTFHEPLAAGLSATKLLRQNPRRALPEVRLASIPGAPHGDEPLFEWKNLDPKSLALHDTIIAIRKDPARALHGAGRRAAHLFGRFAPELREAVRALIATGKPDKAAQSTQTAQIATELLAMLELWEPRRDLLGSGPEERHFAVEIDDRRRARLRFGKGGLGRAPDAGMAFRASYRFGNGPAGNVGADTIILHDPPDLLGADTTVRNPLPATGGVAPESAEEVRRSAPHAFRRELERAITAEDYAALAERHPGVQRAAAELRWSGSHYVAHVAIDASGTEVAPAALVSEIQAALEPRRRIGHEVRVGPAVLVPLRVALEVCVRPHFQPAHVKAALLDLFSHGLRANGEPGFFHPDALSFGDAIRLSKIVALAQAVPGVGSVRVTELRRALEPADRELENGLLPLGPREIARCDSDPTFPEHGSLTIDIGGTLL